MYVIVVRCATHCFALVLKFCVTCIALLLRVCASFVCWCLHCVVDCVCLCCVLVFISVRVCHCYVARMTFICGVPFCVCALRPSWLCVASLIVVARGFIYLFALLHCLVCVVVFYWFRVGS